ncbi:MAG: efflux RND transporter permease subunit [Phycisphaerae bacterium]|nr:efflux RND transporter permease subunit [Phycisphaerae bacterium]
MDRHRRRSLSRGRPGSPPADRRGRGGVPVSLAAVAIEKRTITVFATILLMVGGIASFSSLGQLEDPEFTVKSASVTTTYPGAGAEEVELEVTDRIELAIQEMPQIRQIESISRPGLSMIKIDILPQYPSKQLPQIWDELRKKIRDVQGSLPPGAGKPVVGDDFGDVYGFLLAVVGDGFTYAELEKHIDALKKELSLVKGVARVETWGVQKQCMYIDVTEARLSQLGLTLEDVQHTLTQQNMIVQPGGMDVQDERLRIETTGEFRSPEEIEQLVIRGRSLTGGATDELITVRDVGTVRRGYVEPPMARMRYNGRPSIGLALSNRSGVNIVDLGAALDARINEMVADLPVGVEIRRIAWQSDLVDQSISDFMISLAEAVAIVLIVLWVAMGLRTAFIVGVCGLVFVIIATFLVMKLWGIDLQRMSLGALIVAMGMMVDNAIVVADGVLTRMQRGMDRVKAAVEAATQPSMPLLGATIVAVMAFYPIYASEEGAGEYCASLFQVVAISLMISWVLSVTITPVMCVAMLPTPKGTLDEDALYSSGFYRKFRGLLARAMRRRWPVLGILIALLAASGFGFRFINQMFFPSSARAQFMIDYWAPEGTRIQQVSADLRKIEQKLMEHPMAECVSAFIGMGPPRFYLPVEPEKPYQSYAQLIVNTRGYEGVKALIPEMQAWIDQNVAGARVIIRKYGLGPSNTWSFEARFSGPAIADPNTLRALGEQAEAIVSASPEARIVRTNWRQRVKKMVAEYDQKRGRWTGVTRKDVADATRRAYDGLPVGTFREEDKMLPIILRNVEVERRDFANNIDIVQVRPSFSSRSVPLTQVTSSVGVEWEDPIIWRFDRRRAVTVQAVPVNLASELRADVVDAIEKMPLPPGYALEWDSEYKDSRDAQASLIPGVIPAVLIMAMIVVALFNAYRPPIIIVCAIPFALIGITVGLLVTRQPFGFVALLGAMSLAGMMIKNAIVLLDQVNIELAAGKPAYQAVMDSAICRLRPVMLAAGTTVLGVIPLLQDVFWVALAVTIMFGLAFGSILTMVLIPVLYACFFRLPSPEQSPEATTTTE